MYPPHDGDPRRLVDLAVRVEQAGLDAAWIGDSLLAKPRAEPLSVLAAVAVATERIDIGHEIRLGTEIASWLRGFIDARREHLCIRLASPDVDTQLDRLTELLPELRS